MGRLPAVGCGHLLAYYHPLDPSQACSIDKAWDVVRFLLPPTPVARSEFPGTIRVGEWSVWVPRVTCNDAGNTPHQIYAPSTCVVKSCGGGFTCRMGQVELVRDAPPGSVGGGE